MVKKVKVTYGMLKEDLMLRVSRLYWRRFHLIKPRTLNIYQAVLNIAQRLRDIDRRCYRTTVGPGSRKLTLLSPTVKQMVAASEAFDEKNLGYVNGITSYCKRIGRLNVIDVGANIGYWSAVLAVTGPDLTIFSIEPDKRNISFCGKNLASISNTYLISLGLSERVERLAMEIPSPSKAMIGESAFNTGLLSVCRDSVRTARRNLFVDGERLMDLCGLRPVDLGWIKIDVEGYENEVLHGLSGVLGQADCVVEFEVNQRLVSREGLLNIWQFFESLEYVLVARTSDDARLENREFGSHAGSVNLLACKNKLLPELTKSFGVVRLRAPS